MKLITVDRIVRSTIMSRRYTIHHYGMFLHYGLSWLREMNFDALGEVKTWCYNLDSFKSITLPADYIDLSKIGIERDGKVQTIGSKASLARTKKPYSLYDEDNDNRLYVGGDGFGSLSAEVFNQHPNAYKILLEQNRIQFDTDMPNCKVYIEYLASGGELHGLSLVHPYAQAAMESYIIWQHKEHSRTISNYDRERARKEYFNARRTLLLRKSDLSLQTILRIIRQNSHQGIKN